MLEFNPGFRPTARDLLNHKVFDSIRNKKFEAEAPYQIHQEIFQPGVYDYENDVELLYNEADYKDLLYEEIRQFKAQSKGKDQDLFTYSRKFKKPSDKLKFKTSMAVLSPRKSTIIKSV